MQGAHHAQLGLSPQNDRIVATRLFVCRTAPQWRTLPTGLHRCDVWWRPGSPREATPQPVPDLLNFSILLSNTLVDLNFYLQRLLLCPASMQTPAGGLPVAQLLQFNPPARSLV